MKKTALFVLLFTSFAMFGCAKSSTDSATDGNEAVSNISESAMSEAGQQASSAEGAASPGLMAERDYVDPLDQIHTTSACTFTGARSACTGAVDTLTWGGCSVNLATLTGGWTETWSANANCTAKALTATSDSVVRTSSSQVLTLPSGATITTNTTAHTAYDGTALPATGVTTTLTNSGAGQRTIVIDGVHRVLVGPHGRTLFDHSLTSTGLISTGKRSTSNRVVTGNLTLYHNLLKYKAVHTFNSVTWGSSSCCYPTSGSISSVLTGTGRSGNVSLAFSATCGQATFTDTDSSTSTVTLTQCN